MELGQIKLKFIWNHKIPQAAEAIFLTTDTIEQAIERAGSKAGNKGFEAMNSVIEMISLYKNLKA